VWFSVHVCNCVCEYKGGKKKGIPFRRQRMEIDDMVPPSNRLSITPVSEDPYVADLLKVADENIARLREDAQVAREETTGLEGKVNNLRCQVMRYLFVCKFDDLLSQRCLVVWFK